MTRTLLITALTAALLSSTAAQAGPKLVIHICKGNHATQHDDGQTATRQHNRRVESGKIKL